MSTISDAALTANLDSRFPGLRAEAAILLEVPEDRRNEVKAEAHRYLNACGGTYSDALTFAASLTRPVA